MIDPVSILDGLEARIYYLRSALEKCRQLLVETPLEGLYRFGSNLLT